MTLNFNTTLRDRFILFLVFLFPILIATVRHAASTIYGILVALSLFYCKRSWKILGRREKTFLTALGLFFLISLLSLFMTEDLREGFKRLERYFRLVLFIPIYLMLRSERIETGKAFLVGIVVAVFVMLGQSLYQVEVLKEAIAHGAYHKIILGDLAIFYATLISIGTLYFVRKKRDYLLAGLAIFAGAYTSLLSGTRTSWFFVPIIFLFLIWFCRKDLNRKAWKSIAVGMGICVLLVGGLQPERLTQGLAQGMDDLKTFQQDPTRETSWGSRLVMWHNSILIFKKSPFLGTGMGDFKTDSKKLFKDGMSFNNEFALNQSHAHNIYLQLLAEGGLVGLVMLIVALFVVPSLFLRDLCRHRSDPWLRFYTLSGFVSVFAFAWFGISESWTLRNPMITAYCMVILVFLTSAANRVESES
ncbi:O-antigen ligase family protein [Nitrospira defluvii]|nr:O-antigen ligase family protein [Nitrospira defluvii]